MNNLGDLPVEIVTLIVYQLSRLQDLYTCALINKRFSTVTTPFLWRTIDIRNATALVQVITGVVESSSSGQLGHYIRHFKFGSYVSDVSDATLLLLMIHLPYLEQLKIARGNRITDASLRYVPRHCPHLRSLSLEDSRITHQALVSFDKLTTLTLENCSGLSFDVFAALHRCPLETLNITFSAINDHDCGRGADALMGFSRLIHLSIFDAGHHFIRRLISNNAWPHLKDLYLNNCHLIDDTLMIRFLTSHGDLQCLGLSENTFSDAVLDAIATFSPGLEVLDLRASQHITHHGIRHLVHHCLSLSFMALHECGMTTREFPELRADRCHGHGYVMGILQHITVSELDQDDINKIRTHQPQNNNT